MPVTSVLASTVVVPLEIGAAIATRAIQNREYTLVQVKNNSGLEGVGFCYGGSRPGLRHRTGRGGRGALLRRRVAIDI